MIKTINTLQNIDETTIEKYVVNALANMGQRGSFENYGFSYKTFNALDILNESTINDDVRNNILENISHYCLAITENSSNHSLSFSVIDKDIIFDTSYSIGDDSRINVELYKDVNFNNCVKLKNDVLFDTSVANIFALRQDSLIYNSNDYIIFHGKGLISGNNSSVIYENDGRDTAFIYSKYNVKNSNSLDTYYRTGPCKLTDDTLGYYLCKLVKGDQQNKYDMAVTIIALDANTVAENYMMFNDTAQNGHVNGSIESLINFNENDTSTTIGRIISLFKDENNIILTKTKSNISIDATSEQLSEMLSAFDDLSTYNIDALQLINDVNNQKSLMIYDLLDYHNNLYYKSSKACLIRRLLGDLYFNCKDKVDEKYADLIDSSTEINNPVLYIPFDIDFHYVCDNSDPLKIYYTNTLYILICNINHINQSINDIHNNLIFDYDIMTDKYEINAYDIQVYYNDEYNDIISNMSLKNIYSMPSIQDGEWYINGVKTGIPAKGKDAGNPNIIILSYDSTSQEDENIPGYPEILNVPNSKYYEFKRLINDEDSMELYNLKLNEFSEVNIYVPTIDINNIDVIKDSLLFYYIKTNIKENENDSGTDFTILTLWYPTSDGYEYVKTTSEYIFYIISSKDEEADYEKLDARYVNNNDILSIIKTYLEKTISLDDEEGFEYIENIKSNKYTIEFTQSDEQLAQQTETSNSNSNNLIGYQFEIYNKTKEYFNSVDQDNLYENNINLALSLTNENKVKQIDFNSSENINVYAVPIDTTYEYQLSVKSANIPSVTMKDVLLKDINTVNRLNIISVEKDETTNAPIIYNSYIGSQFDSPIKSTLTIGSSNTNINLNTVDNYTFNKQDTLKLDFDKTLINSSIILNDSLELSKFNYDKSNIEIYNVSVPICGRINKNSSSLITLYTSIYNNIDIEIKDEFGDDALYIEKNNNVLTNNNDDTFILCKIIDDLSYVGPNLVSYKYNEYADTASEVLVAVNLTKLIKDQIKYIDFASNINSINLLLNDNGHTIKTYKAGNTVWMFISLSKTFIKEIVKNEVGNLPGISTNAVYNYVFESNTSENIFMSTGDILNSTIKFDKSKNTITIYVSPQKEYYLNNIFKSKKYGLQDAN